MAKYNIDTITEIAPKDICIAPFAQIGESISAFSKINETTSVMEKTKSIKELVSDNLNAMVPAYEAMAVAAQANKHLSNIGQAEAVLKARADALSQAAKNCEVQKPIKSNIERLSEMTKDLIPSTGSKQIILLEDIKMLLTKILTLLEQR